jgi:hypothetical protein
MVRPVNSTSSISRMCRPSTANGRLGGVGARGHAARAEVVAVQVLEITPGLPTASRPAGRLQPLGQPGAARTRCPPARHRGGSSCARRRAARPYSASASSCSVLMSRFSAASAGTGRGSPRQRRHRGHARRCAAASVVRVALVDLVHRQAEAAVQLAGEALGAPGVVVRAPSGWKGTPTTSASGCHSAIRRRWRRSGIAFGSHGGQRLAWRSRVLPVATPTLECRSQMPGLGRLGLRAAPRRAPAAWPQGTSGMPRLLAEHARVEAQQRHRTVVALGSTGVSKMIAGSASTVSQPLRPSSSSSWPAPSRCSPA